VEFSQRAAAEVHRAREWWQEHREKAPGAFDEAMLELVATLEQTPELLGEHARNMPGIRRVYLRRVRYHAYYRVAGHERHVQILSLWHASRGQEPNL